MKIERHMVCEDWDLEIGKVYTLKTSKAITDLLVELKQDLVEASLLEDYTDGYTYLLVRHGSRIGHLVVTLFPLIDDENDIILMFHDIEQSIYSSRMVELGFLP